MHPMHIKILATDNEFVVVYPVNAQNVLVTRDLLETFGWEGTVPVRFVLPASRYLFSGSIAAPALDVEDVGGRLTLEINGAVYGKGGNGQKLNGADGVVIEEAQAGGPAIRIAQDVTIAGTGFIAGGGGGGASTYGIKACVGGGGGAGGGQGGYDSVTADVPVGGAGSSILGGQGQPGGSTGAPALGGQGGTAGGGGGVFDTANSVSGAGGGGGSGFPGIGGGGGSFPGMAPTTPADGGSEDQPGDDAWVGRDGGGSAIPLAAGGGGWGAAGGNVRETEEPGPPWDQFGGAGGAAIVTQGFSVRLTGGFSGGGHLHGGLA